MTTANERPIFQFPEVTTAHLTHFQSRKEKHGDNDVLAVDIRLRRDAPAEQLALLAPGLREALYWNRAEQGKPPQERLPGLIAVLPDLLFPELNAAKFLWNKGQHVAGFRFVLDYGTGNTEGLDLSECRVTNWAFETKANGLSSLWWTVQCSGEQVTDRLLALMPKLVDTDVHFQLFAPPVYELVKGNKKAASAPAPNPDQQTLDDGGGDDTQEGSDNDPLPPGSPEAALVHTKE